MKTYILNTADYTFTPYADGGFSGKLLLATAKNPDLSKLIIKSDNPSSACNEFMYARLAELLQIPAPKAYVLSETYSIAVAVFYEAYITLLKKEIAYYLKSLGEHI